MVYHFCSGGGGTGRYPEDGACFDKYIHPLLAIYDIPRDLVNLVVPKKKHAPTSGLPEDFWKGWGLEEQLPTKKGALTYPFFMFWKDPPRSYKKGVRSYHRYFFTSSKGKVHRPWSFCRELLLAGNRLL